MKLLSAIREKLHRLLPLILILQVLGALPAALVTAPKAEALTACVSGGAAQNSLTVTPTHGKAFYIDSGVSPKLDAGYVGYRVVNTSASAKTGLWVSLNNFTGGKISLANPVDQYYQLDNLGISGSGSESSTAYILLKASGSSTSGQSHDVKVYDRRPDLSGATMLYGCTFTFTAVKETIKASANKMNDAGSAGTDFDANTDAIDISTTTAELGQNITMTIEGVTGQIGAGGAPDYDIIWLTPAAVSSWPTAALRLIDSSIQFVGNPNNSWSSQTKTTFSDSLLITGANGLSNVDTSRYVATFTFRVIGIPQASVLAVPLAFIASGTQVKHSDTTATGGTRTINFTAPTINYSLSKTVVSNSNLETTTVGGSTYVKIPYRLTATSTSSTQTFIDEFVDIPASAGIFDTGSATVIDIDRTSATAIPDPTYLSSESSLSPRPLHFVGPFKISSSRSVVISYKILVPAAANTYSNTAYIQVGDIQVGASASTIPKVNVTTNGTDSITSETTTVSLSATVITQAASAVDTSVATLNGTIDPNGLGGIAQFHYGTNPSLSSYTVETATTPSNGTLTGSNPVSISKSLTGLSPGTTYYYRALTGSTYGDIFSFTTTGIVATPSVVTLSASSVGSTSATFNGTVDPNNTFIYAIKFGYKASATDPGSAFSTSGSGADKVTLTETVEGTTSNVQASGDGIQNFSYSVTGLSASTKYYFYIQVCTTSNCSAEVTGSNQNFTTGFASQTITFPAITDKTYGDVAFSAGATASSTLTVTYQSLTTSVCTISGSTVTIVAAGICTLRASQSGGTVSSTNYNAAEDVDQSFTINPKSLTATAVDKSKQYGGSTPSNELSLSGFVGSEAATVTSAVYTYAGTGSTSYSPSTTAPSDVGSYSLNPSGALLNFSSGNANNYEISYVSGTYTISVRSITVTSISKTKVYGASDPVLTGFIISSGSLAGSDTFTVSASRSSGENVGSYAITPSSASFFSGNSANYSITYIGDTLTITAKTLVVTADNKSKIQGEPNPSFSSTVTGFSGSDSATVSSAIYTFTGTGGTTYASSTETPTATGNYTNLPSSAALTFTVGSSSNYSLSYASGTYTIQSASLQNQSTLSINSSTTVIYGNTLSLTTTGGSGNGALTFAVTTAGTAGCSISGSTLSHTGAVGTTCGVTATKAADAQYNSTSSSEITITIIVRPITVTSVSKSKVYGASDPTLTGFTITSGTLVGSETFTVTATRTSGENVGTYAITPSSASFSPGSASNYSITYVGDTLTVTAKTLTITADNKSTPVGGSTPTFTVTLSGLIGSDTATATAMTYTFTGIAPTSYSASTSAPSTASAGSYTIAPSAGTLSFTTGSSGNYSYSYANGTYTVSNKTSQSISLAAATVSYNATLTLTASGISGSGAITYSTSDSGCSIAAAILTALSGTGTCTVTATIAEDATYNSASTTATITLAKINQTISFTQPSNMSVGASAQALTYSATSSLTVTLTNNSSSICTLSGGNASPVAAGTCSLTASQSGDNNYNAATDVTVTFTISAATSGGGSSTPTNSNPTTPVKIKLKPIITWSDPEDIDEGVPLENRELDAICSVPGTLTYSPPLGTILPGGIHTLSVTCTPTDSENYEPVSKQVKINVIPAPPSAISHRLIFMPTAKCLTPSMAASLERFLDKVAANTTEEFSLQVYFSGGFFNEDPETPMTEDAKARYQCLCQAFLDNEISAQIFTGIFSGPTNTVEIIVSWVRK